MRLFCPCDMQDAVISQANGLPGMAGRVSASQGTFDLESVRAANIRFACTGLTVRFPFVHPFSLGGLRNEYPGEYCSGAGIDWVWLDRSLEGLPSLLAGRFNGREQERLEIVFFEALAGQMTQARRADEPETLLARAAANYNLPQWEAACSDMLDSPEERWGEYAPNSVDFYPKLAPHIDKALAHPPTVILDLGCGVGQTARSLALRYPRATVYGIDSSHKAIEVADRHFQHPNLNFLVGSIGQKLPFNDRSVDLIVAVNSLMYGQDQEATAREVFRVLSARGLLIHYSRMLESHMFWDFPASLAGPSIFQLNAADWILAGRKQGYRTRLQDDPSMMTTWPGFFRPSRYRQFAEAYEHGVHALKKSTGNVFRSFHAHGLFLASRAVEDNCGVLERSNYLERLDAALCGAAMANQGLEEAFVLGWNTTFADLELHPLTVDFLARCLPLSGDLVKVVMAVGA